MRHLGVDVVGHVLQDCSYLTFFNAFEPVQEFLHGGSRGKVSEEGCDGDPGLGEEPVAAVLAWDAFDSWAGAPVDHASPPVHAYEVVWHFLLLEAGLAGPAVLWVFAAQHAGLLVTEGSGAGC